VRLFFELIKICGKTNEGEGEEQQELSRANWLAKKEKPPIVEKSEAASNNRC
jgi:hypothetical protein